ncbi:MAG: amino acid adenylation domain-containing protein [Polyangiaceae bacterium]
MKSAGTNNEQSSFALSSEQRAVLAMVGGEARLSAANRLLTIDIEGPLDAERLRTAVQSVRSRHGALRSAFLPVAGYRGLRQQQLAEPPPVKWQELDVRVAGDVPRWLNAFKGAPLAIERGEVLRPALIVRAPDRHTLALVLSPLAVDGGSVTTLLAEIREAYVGALHGGSRAPFEYAQFVEWRQELETGDEAMAGSAYWSRYLDGVESPLGPRLPGRSRHESAERGTVTHEQAIERALTVRVIDVAREQGVSVESLLQGVWWLLLARLTRFSGFLGGWQHDCRADYEVMQGAVGVFAKVLPIAIDVRPEQPFVAWVSRLEQVVQAHTEAQEYWSVEAPPISGHQSVGFVFRSAAAPTAAGSPFRLQQSPSALPCFELALEVAVSEGGGELSLHADRDWYSDLTAEVLARQFLNLLQAALEQPRARVADLPLVTDAERQQLLALTEQRDFGQESVAMRIARWAELTPDAPAIEEGAQSLSYHALEMRVRRGAQWLTSQGVQPGALVALNLPRSLELLVALLATWRAGAAYLPLEPEWPRARREALFRDSGAVLCLSAQVNAGAEGSQIRELAIEQLSAERPLETLPLGAGSLSDAAYVLYTSGSTGAPKGVVIEHGQLLNYVAAATNAMSLQSARRWALTSSVVADLGNTALFGALFNGACLVVASPESMKDAPSFASFMAERQIDALKIVPSHLDALLECDAPILPRTLVLGGEAASRSLLERVLRLDPECTVYNHYGPTETTIGVMVHRLDATQPLPEVLPLSRTLENNRVVVLDAALQLVPPGGQGDVYIAGSQLCRGYLNDAAREAFIVDPHQPNARLYRTGDVALVLLDGAIQLAGRADQQLKIRGFRVDPAEVEAALLAQPGVRQGAVIATSGATGQPELVAVTMIDDGLSVEGVRSALRQALATLLPAHMVPARYDFRAQFPRLANGKVDRIALANAVRAQNAERSIVAPRDALEFVLVACMSRLLGFRAISIHDDFFELGGHSLLVIKLVARIRKLLDTNVAPAVVFDHRSAAALAEALRTMSEDREHLERSAETQRASLAETAPNSGHSSLDPGKSE